MPRPGDPNAKKRLLDAARRVFLERGLDRAKVEEITVAAGMSKGAFYLHFKSKDDAFREILSGALAELGGLVAELESSRSEWAAEPPDRLVRIWLEQQVRIFECIWRHRTIMRLVLDGGGSPDYQHLIEMFAESAERATERLIRFGIERGHYRPDLEPSQAAAFCAGGYDRIARRLVRQKAKPDIPGWLAEAQRLCIFALGTPSFRAATENLATGALSQADRKQTA